jgi:hypothetical protein
MDVVMTYCFADQGFNTLDVEDFNSPNLRALGTSVQHGTVRLLL